MPVEEFPTVLPLDDVLLDNQIPNLEVKSHGSGFFCEETDRCEELSEDELDRLRVSEADAGNRGDAEGLDLVHEELVDLRSFKLVKTANGFLCVLVDCNFPIHRG